MRTDSQLGMLHPDIADATGKGRSKVNVALLMFSMRKVPARLGHRTPLWEMGPSDQNKALSSLPARSGTLPSAGLPVFGPFAPWGIVFR